MEIVTGITKANDNHCNKNHNLGGTRHCSAYTSHTVSVARMQEELQGVDIFSHK